MPSLNTKLASAPNTTSNYVLRATSSTTIGNSTIQDDGTNVAIGTTPGTYKLNVSGTGNFTGALSGTSATFSSSVTANSTLSAYYGSITAGNTPATSGTTPVNPMLNLTNNRGIGMYFGGKYSGDYAQWIQVSDTGNLGVNYPLLLNPNGGNVGIGTSSPSNKLTISNDGNAAVAFRINDTNANASFLSLNVSNSDAAIIAGGTSGIPFDIYTGGSIRMRIRNDGITMIGTTTYNSALKGILLNPDGYAFYTADGASVMYLNRLTSDGLILEFQKNTVITGSISTNTYSLPSDLNFKKNISNLELGLNLITKLRAVSYNHKIDDDDAALSTGFIAQELEQSLTELGVKENDYYILQHKPNEDKKQSQYWLDYTKMIPVLVKAIQEQTQLITELEARIKQLENK